MGPKFKSALSETIKLPAFFITTSGTLEFYHCSHATKSFAKMTTTRLLMLLLHLWAIAPASALFGLSNPWKSTNNQQPFLLTSSSPSSNYSVGFSLASSYGAAAVIIDEPNGDKKTLTWTVNGSSEYQSVMTKLSLTTSQHLA